MGGDCTLAGTLRKQGVFAGARRLLRRAIVASDVGSTGDGSPFHSIQVDRLCHGGSRLLAPMGGDCTLAGTLPRNESLSMLCVRRMSQELFFAPLILWESDVSVV